MISYLIAGLIKAFEQKLAETEAALRETNEKAYQRSRADVLWNLHYYASPRCSGLLRRPEELVLSSEKSKPHPDRPLLDINVADCLSVQLAKTKADAVLRPEDLRFLRVAVTRTAEALEEQRAKAIEAMLQMETKSTEELYAFAPKSPFAQQMGEWLDMVWQAYPELLPSDPRTGEHSRAVRNAQERIAWNFEEQVRVEIRTLRDIAWPDPDVAK